MAVSSRSGCPTRCLHDDPSSQSIRLGGRFISIPKLAEAGGFDTGYLSYIMAAKRTPSVKYAQRIAEALGILTTDGIPDTTRLFELIEQRREEEETERKRRLA